MVAAVLASAGLASCGGEAPTEANLSQELSGVRDSTGGDSIGGDTIPDDSVLSDTVPTDTIPPDTIPPDTVPTDTIPPDTVPTDTIPPDTVPTDTIPPDTTIVRAFDLVVTVVGADPSGDTLQTVRLSGARVTLSRFASLPDSGSVPDAVISTRRTGRDGQVVFHRLQPAWYRVDVEPPAGSPYLPGSALVAPARSTSVSVQVLLSRAP
jgi:hypothetical protein